MLHAGNLAVEPFKSAVLLGKVFVQKTKASEQPRIVIQVNVVLLDVGAKRLADQLTWVSV